MARNKQNSHKLTKVHRLWQL